MTSPPEPAAPAPDGTADERITALEHGQVSIEGKLDRLLSLISPGKDEPAAPAEPEGERPELVIAREIRDGIARLAGSKPAEPAAVNPADLEEKPPVAPVRRVTSFMGWDRE